MSTTLSIGDFSLMTRLSIKTLRYYHEVGLLEPAEVNPDTGYRYYGVEQLPTAQIIQRFRDLGMPIDEVKAVLAAPDLDTRNALIATHLGRLEGTLSRRVRQCSRCATSWNSLTLRSQLNTEHFQPLRP